jgi:cellulose synthase/poly-beta-1,6-N-acetylglucosamine synthase-like glycosyltransferase
MLAELTAVVALPWLWDAGVRLMLARFAELRPARPTTGDHEPGRWLVLVPARGEGAAVEPTLRTAMAAAEGRQVTVLLVLDGPDETARTLAENLGVEVVLKDPAGPTKGAVLAWAASVVTERFAQVDAIMVLDVGSTLPADFFTRFEWPPGADVVQSRLRGSGDGIGRTVSLSESAAQLWQDRGRQALGWAVRLRGTGTFYRPQVLRRVAPELGTSVEDTEATLLLASWGARLALGPEGAAVADVKPEGVGEAARQRSRWLAGQLGLLARRSRSLLRLVHRRPLEGAAFIAELLSRPLSVTGPLRLLAGVGFAVAASLHGWPPWESALAAVLLASTTADLYLLRKTGVTSWRALLAGLLSLSVSWLVAVALLPAALFGWVRGRRP